jgi:hypothetical protein
MIAVRMTEALSVRLTAWAFYRKWLSWTFGGAKGVLGDLSLFLGISLAVAHARYPKGSEAIIHKIPGVVGYEDFVALAPLTIGGIYLLVRFLAAPLRILREYEAARAEEKEAAARTDVARRAEFERERQTAADTISQLQRRIARLESPTPRVTLRFTGDSGAPLAVKNVGPVEAHRVKISDLEVGSEYVEFAEVDPLESNAPEQVPEFRVLTRGEDAVSPAKLTDFGWFLRVISEAETYAVWREAAGLPATDFGNDIEAFKETLDLGPPRHPAKVSYTDSTGARQFETVYRWYADRGGEDMALEYDGWLEVTQQ